DAWSATNAALSNFNAETTLSSTREYLEQTPNSEDYHHVVDNSPCTVPGGMPDDGQLCYFMPPAEAPVHELDLVVNSTTYHCVLTRPRIRNFLACRYNKGSNTYSVALIIYARLSVVFSGSFFLVNVCAGYSISLPPNAEAFKSIQFNRAYSSINSL